MKLHLSVFILVATALAIIVDLCSGAALNPDVNTEEDDLGNMERTLESTDEDPSAINARDVEVRDQRCYGGHMGGCADK